MPKDAAITTRVPKAVKAEIARLARSDGRSESQYVERIIMAHLAQKNSRSGVVEKS